MSLEYSFEGPLKVLDLPRLVRGMICNFKSIRDCLSLGPEVVQCQNCLLRLLGKIFIKSVPEANSLNIPNYITKPLASGQVFVADILEFTSPLRHSFTSVTELCVLGLLNCSLELEHFYSILRFLLLYHSHRS